MFNQNCIHRVFQLINPLKSTPAKSIKRLTESMEVSERSFYRYNEIVASHYSKIISTIKEALKSKSQVLLVKYQLASSESITDRLVEPVGFTNNYQYLCAYDVESQLNKYFKVDRMGSIEILSETLKFSIYTLLGMVPNKIFKR